MKRKITTLLAGLFVATAMACSGDTTSNQGSNHCASGEHRNPSGDCVPNDYDDGDAGELTDGKDGTKPNDARDPSELEDWEDESGDGVPNRLDNCPFDYNPDQLDSDGDGVGDVCDNCPDVYNPDQTDTSGNGVGDACEPEPAGDICLEQTSEFVQIDPNIYIILDKSGSMDWDNCWPEATAALNMMADELADDVNFGMLIYPEGNGNACDNSGKEILPMAAHTSQEVKDSFSSVRPNGGTPTGGALKQVRINNLYGDPNDPLDDVRPKAVVLITDGDPNGGNCGASSAQAYSVQEAGALAAIGIPVHIVGYSGGAEEAKLVEMAAAGGTSPFTRAVNTQQLLDVLRDISEDVISCSYSLDELPEDPNKIWVEVNGVPIVRNDPNGFNYDASNNTLTLEGDSCDTLKSTAPGAATPLKISLGCATADECVLTGGACESSSACCDGDCDEGVCVAPCRPTGVTCEENSDCCSSSCALGQDGEKVCILG